jgi:hypothetical protein
MSGTASAQPGDQDGEAGVIGTDNDPVDIEASDIEVDDLVVNGTATGPFGGDIDRGQAKIFPTSQQTIPEASVTEIVFGSSQADLNSGPGLTVDLGNNRITAELSGVYLVASSIGFQPSVENTVLANFTKLDGNRIATTRASSGDDNTTLPSFSIEAVTTPPANFTVEGFTTKSGSQSLRTGVDETNLLVAKIA